MMKTILRLPLIILLILYLLLQDAQLSLAQGPQITAILFYSPTCPHCHVVMEEDIPPLLRKYGSQLSILQVNVNTGDGFTLYQSALERFQVPEGRLGVPALFVQDTHLVGSIEIPEQFPGIIEAGLGSGGIDWPDIPGVQEYIAAHPEALADVPKLTSFDRFALDPVGNSIAFVVLVGMVVSVFSVLLWYQAPLRRSSRLWPGWMIPVLSVLGIVIAGYLSYVELTHSEAVCGPVGDCNAVQQSSYARLFGVLPVGLLGLFGYLLIIAAWLVQQYGPEKWRRYSALSVWGLALVAVLFMIYLTFLEPFVIGATCAWCLATAVILTLILWASTEPARRARRSGQKRMQVHRANRPI